MGEGLARVQIQKFERAEKKRGEKGEWGGWRGWRGWKVAEERWLQKMREEEENKVFKPATATGRAVASSKKEKQSAGGWRMEDGGGGLAGGGGGGGDRRGREMEVLEERKKRGSLGERAAVRILISGNWSLREQKLGDGEGRAAPQKEPPLDRVISLSLCTSPLPSALPLSGLFSPFFLPPPSSLPLTTLTA